MKKIRSSQMATAPVCQKRKDNQLFKCFVWASSIMAIAPVCRAGNPCSNHGSSTATKKGYLIQLKGG